MDSIHVATYIGFNQRINILDSSEYMKSPNWFHSGNGGYPTHGKTISCVAEQLDEMFSARCDWLLEEIKKFKAELEPGENRYGHLAYAHQCLAHCYRRLDALVGSAEEEVDTI